jgi:exodeoxyribonuclease VII small subunit
MAEKKNTAENAADAEESKDLSIEEAFDRLQETLTKLQDDSVPLEESFGLYEQGMKLVKYCNEKIDRVEKKVEKLNAEGGLEEFEVQS